MPNRFVQGVELGARALRNLEEQEPKAGGFYIRLFGDGSGCLVEEDFNFLDDKERFHFRNPAELWEWLHADAITRERMAREYYEREQLATPEEVERALRMAVEPETIQ